MKMEKRQSVFTFAYTKRYYLRHPLRFLRELSDNLREALHRARYGWAPRDCWNLGYWLLDVLPQMLIYLVDNGTSYPGNERFPTLESWRNHLLSIANLLENARDEVRDGKNEFYPAYEEETNKNRKREWITDEKGNRIYQPIDNTITKKYIKRDAELTKEQEVMIEEALKLLAETPLRAIWN